MGLQAVQRVGLLKVAVGQELGLEERRLLVRAALMRASSAHQKEQASTREPVFPFGFHQHSLNFDCTSLGPGFEKACCEAKPKSSSLAPKPGRKKETSTEANCLHWAACDA